MKPKMREQLSVPVTESKHLSGVHENIELLNCPLKEIMCEAHFSGIKLIFLESEQYIRNKEFSKSIEVLKVAFQKTSELMEHPCTRCTQLYQTIIVESLEGIYDELGKLVSGIFGNKSFQPMYKEAENALKEFENFVKSSYFQINEIKEKFLGNHLN